MAADGCGVDVVVLIDHGVGLETLDAGAVNPERVTGPFVDGMDTAIEARNDGKAAAGHGGGGGDGLGKPVVPEERAVMAHGVEPSVGRGEEHFSEGSDDAAAPIGRAL